MTNPLLTTGSLPPFPAIRPEHVEPAVRERLAANRAHVAEIERSVAPSFRTVVEPLEDLQHGLTLVWSPVSHLNAVVNSDALRASYNACLPLLSDYQTDLAHSEPLYRAYAHIVEREGATLDAEQRRVIELALRDFRLAGVALDRARKDRFKAMMAELTQLQAKFEENVLDATNAWSHQLTDEAQLRGLNAGIVEAARQRALERGLEGWVLGLDQPTYVAVVTDAESEPLRRAFYEAWSTRASDRGPTAGRFDNTPVMERIVRLRHEIARLLDFRSFAEYALATRMARSPQAVTDFLLRLARAARPAAQQEFAELEAFA
ncbi:MAG: M3 family metallopeptidase, partial [Steroidobacteraceae bacterium]